MTHKELIVAIIIGATAFAGNMLSNWFKEDLHLAFKHFHDKYEREMIENMTTAERIRRDYMLEIERTFRRNGICHHLEYISNSGEAVKDADDDVEFDAVMVVDRHEYELQVFHDNDIPGYAWLKPYMYPGKYPSRELLKVLTHINFFPYIFDGHLYVDRRKTIHIFFNELQNIIKKSKIMKDRVKLIKHDSVIRMDIYQESGFIFRGLRLYSVDLVPAYQIDGALFVSKALKGETLNAMSWRRYFPVRDKENLSDGAEFVLLALLAVRNHEPDLALLTRNQLKHALLYELEAEFDWSDRALVRRFLGVLYRLERSLVNEKLPHYFMRDINLLIPMAPSSMENARNIIQRILSSENELMKILRS